MKKNHLKVKLAHIPEVIPDPEDKEAIRRIDSAADKSTVSIEKIRELRSGQISLRLPRTLHTDLARKAEEEGISLNRYILYILSKD